MKDAPRAFIDEFNAKATEIHTKLIHNTSKDELKAVKTDVSALNQAVEGQLGSLPAFEQKRIGQSMETLFKYVESQSSRLDTREFRFVGEPVPPITGRPVTSARKKMEVEESSQTYQGLTGVKQTVEGSGSHLLVKDTNNSIVVTSSTVPSSMHIKGGAKSVFRVEADGPVFVHDLVDSDLVIRCHQLRLHNLRRCHVWIDQVGNNTIIIENCRELTVGKVGGERVEVDDFDWPTKSAANPHFAYDTEASNYEWIDGVADGPVETARIDQM